MVENLLVHYGILSSVQEENDKLNKKMTKDQETVEIGSEEWRRMVISLEEQRTQISNLIEERNEKSKNKYVERVLETKKVY